MQFKGIIFDLDGTLANTLDDIAGSMNRVLRAHGYPIHPVESYKLLVGRGLDNLVKQALPLYGRSPRNLSVCLKEMIEDYSMNCIVQTHLYKGIRETIDELVRMNIRLAVFSNKAEPLTIKIVDHLLGSVPFIKVAGARPDFPKKPDPTGALYICRYMECLPDSIMYIGDSDVDMITAERGGMYGVGVSWGFRSTEELVENGAKVIIEQPGQILRLIRCPPPAGVGGG